MWRTRPVLLLAIAALVGLVASSYYFRVQGRKTTGPPPPSILPDDTASTANDWVWKQTANGKTTSEIRAKDFRQVREPNKFELKGVELHIFNKDSTSYNLVKSASADFDIGSGVMFSDGAVEITMNVPADEPPNGRLMVIRSSGVHFETKNGKATTDRAATFQFDRGEGQAVGAEYDPQTHELHLLGQVQLIWRGSNPKAPPMHIETSDLRYRESEAKVYLSPWSKMTRDTLTMNGGAAVISLSDGAISLVEAENAQGQDKQPNRSLDFAADRLVMNFDDNGQVNKIGGDRNARLVSESKDSQTTITTDHIDLDLAVVRTGDRSESKLTSALANGHGIVESKPAPGSATANPETRILKSDTIRMKMRDGGEEIESVETNGPGSLEFVPTTANRPHRLLTGDRIWIAYGPANQIQTMRSVNVVTRTDNPKLPGAKQAPPPAVTRSKDLTASFEPKSNQLSHLEQSGAFVYEAGDRKAKADRASLDQAKNLMTLNGGARIWDSTGSTVADRIVLNQKDGDFTADGGVNSTRMPDKNGDSSGMLDSGVPLHARAQHMESKDHNQHILYRGDAVAWQEANRLQADTIEIDREDSKLSAHGHVVSELIEKKSDNPGAANKKPGAPQGPIYTIVHAADLVYTDDDLLARYSGGVLLERPDLTVKGREVLAYLRENSAPADGKKPIDAKTDDDSGSTLDHAFAEGEVRIVAVGPQRTRTGTSEHAEYYVHDGKVILQKGNPQLVDSYKGTTKGNELTWYANDDRLLVNGADKQLVHSLLRRK